MSESQGSERFKSSDSESAGLQSVGPKSLDSKLIDSESSGFPSVDSNSVDSAASGLSSIDSKSLDSNSMESESCDSAACDEPSQSSIIKRLLAFKLTFCRKKAIAEQTRIIDEIVRKNNLVAAKYQAMIEALDVTSYPDSTLPPKYRWSRLVRDLDALSDRLRHVKHLMQHDRVLTAMNMFTFDVWPLTLKIACRHEFETGNQGDWIKDITALHVVCEKYAVDAELAGRVNETVQSKTIPSVQVKNLRSGARVLEVNEGIEDDRSNQKRAS